VTVNSFQDSAFPVRFGMEIWSHENQPYPPSLSQGGDLRSVIKLFCSVIQCITCRRSKHYIIGYKNFFTVSYHLVRRSTRLLYVSAFLIGVLLLILETCLPRFSFGSLHFTPGFGTDDPVIFHIGGGTAPTPRCTPVKSAISRTWRKHPA